MLSNATSNPMGAKNKLKKETMDSRIIAGIFAHFFICINPMPMPKLNRHRRRNIMKFTFTAESDGVGPESENKVNGVASAIRPQQQPKITR